MQQWETCRLNPELRELVVEASLALARLDAERLEELARSCHGLNREMTEPSTMSLERRTDLARQSREATGEMAVFGRVLEVTRANVDVMNRLRELREGRREYGGRAIRCRSRGLWGLAEQSHGND